MDIIMEQTKLSPDSNESLRNMTSRICHRSMAAPKVKLCIGLACMNCCVTKHRKMDDTVNEAYYCYDMRIKS